VRAATALPAALRQPTAPAATEVLFVLLPDTLLLDWAGPAEAFRLANQSLVRLGKPAAFKLRFVGPQSETRSSVGAHIARVEPLPAQLTAPTWLVLLGTPDEAADRHRTQVRDVTHWLRGMAKPLQALHAPHRLVTICAGALLAAQAGLLAHARVATHHLELDALKRMEPLCEVQANRVFVLDEKRKVYSSAGITTGIDLAVHLIAQTCGEAIAARVAQVMVLPLRRGPDDPELSPFLQGRAHMHPGVHRVQDAVGNAPLTEWTVTRMAEIACTSTRHLARLFDDHVGQAPLAYLRSIRLALAEQALSAGQSVSQAATTAGFTSDTQLRRAWHAAGKAGTPSTSAFKAPKHY
jgi:transcriptional regulator GlxA family with amidase domain